MARRLITTLLSVSLALALASAAAAADDEGGAPVRDVPESGLADREIAAVDETRASIEALLDSLDRRLDRLARLSAKPRTAARRIVAVQLPVDDPTETTEVGGENPATTSTTTTTLPATPTTSTTTTTLPPPPPDCDQPDDAAIQAAFDELFKAIQDAWEETEPALDELNRQAKADEAALEAALRAARTVADVERAYADAVANTNTHYDGLIAAFERLKAATVAAGERARAAMLAACADEQTLSDVAEGIAGELAAWDTVIQDINSSRRDDLAALDTEKAEFLAGFVPLPDGGSTPGGGTGGAGGGGGAGDGDGAGGDDAGTGDGDGDGLPLAGTNALPLLVAGLVLVGAGLVTVVVTRRRRDGESAQGESAQGESAQ